MPSKNKKQKTTLVPKYIRTTAKVLELSSTRLARKFAIYLFSTPIKFKTPKREEPYRDQSIQHLEYIPDLDETINVFKYGHGDKKILLVHGWSGRGTQLAHFAEPLQNEYSFLSFDAPAHGLSTGKKSNMLEFISCIKYLDEKYGPFYASIGHSLGGMAIINAASQKVNFQKLVSIGAGDTITDIAYGFAEKLEMKPKMGKKLKDYFDEKMGFDIDEYSTHRAAEKIELPLLIVHDSQDKEVAVSCAHNIRQHCKNAEYLETQGLGHTKILRDANVINHVIEFIKN